MDAALGRPRMPRTVSSPVDGGGRVTIVGDQLVIELVQETRRKAGGRCG